MWETLIGIAVGAVLAFLPTWILSNRAHKWEVEEKKRERASIAREIRLKEGEEKIKEETNRIDYFERMLLVLFNAKGDSDNPTVSKLMEESVKENKEIQKANSIFLLSVKSLGDEQLNNTLREIYANYITYGSFYIETLEIFRTNGITAMQKEKSKYVDREFELMKTYASSVENFFKRINELRSQ